MKKNIVVVLNIKAELNYPTIEVCFCRLQMPSRTDTLSILPNIVEFLISTVKLNLYNVSFITYNIT